MRARRSGPEARRERSAGRAPVPADPCISLEAFKKIDLRTGIIQQAEKIPKSEKLLRRVVDIGEERQVVAGLAQTHAPRDLVGKQVIVLTNLEPTGLMGVESRGMVLAVRDGDALSLLTTERPVASGQRVT